MTFQAITAVVLALTVSALVGWIFMSTSMIVVLSRRVERLERNSSPPEIRPDGVGESWIP